MSARSLGPQTLNSVAAPVSVYALSATDLGEPARRPHRSLVVLVAGLAGIVLLATALFVATRADVQAWAALELPKIFGHPIDQQISLAETPAGVRIAYATTGPVLPWSSRSAGAPT